MQSFPLKIKSKLPPFRPVLFPLFVVILLLSNELPAQDTATYEKAFQEKFPQVAAPMWIRKADDNYEATFKLNGVFVSSVYTADGKWLFNKSPVDTGQIPVVVKTAITNKYNGSKITFAEKLETAEKVIQYQVSLKTGTKRMVAIFDDKGNFIKQL